MTTATEPFPPLLSVDEIERIESLFRNFDSLKSVSNRLLSIARAYPQALAAAGRSQVMRTSPAKARCGHAGTIVLPGCC